MKKLLLLIAIVIACASCGNPIKCWKYTFKTTYGTQLTYYHWGTWEELDATLMSAGIYEHQIESVSKSESECKEEKQLTFNF